MFRGSQTVLAAIVACGGCSSPAAPAVELGSGPQSLWSDTFDVGEFVPGVSYYRRSPVDVRPTSDGFLLRVTPEDCVLRLSAGLEQRDIPPLCDQEGVVRASGATLRRFWTGDNTELLSSTLESGETLQASSDPPLTIVPSAFMHQVECAPSGTCVAAWPADRGIAFVRIGDDGHPVEETRLLEGMDLTLLVHDAHGGFRLLGTDHAHSDMVPQLWTARVSEAGSVVEAPHLLHTAAAGEHVFAVAAADDGERTLVVWAQQRFDGSEPKVLAQAVDAEGNTLGAEPALVLEENVWNLQLAGIDGTFLLAYDAGPGPDMPAYRLQLLAADGAALGEPMEPALTRGERNPVAVTARAGSFVVVTSGALDDEGLDEPYAYFMDTSGAVTEPRPVSRDPSAAGRVAAVWDGSQYVVTWSEERVPYVPGVRSARITSTGERIDERSFELAPAHSGTWPLALASSGGSSLALVQTPKGCEALRIGADGVVAAPVLLPWLRQDMVPGVPSCASVSLASSGDGYAAATAANCGARLTWLDEDGRTLGTPVDVSATCGAPPDGPIGSSHAAVVWTGTHYWLTWSRHSLSANAATTAILSVAVAPDGTPSEVTEVAPDGINGALHHALACGGGECVYLWDGQGLQYRRFDLAGRPLSAAATFPGLSEFEGINGDPQIVWDGKAFVVRASDNIVRLWPGGQTEPTPAVTGLGDYPTLLASNGDGRTLIHQNRGPIPWVPVTLQFFDSTPVAPDADGGTAGGTDSGADPQVDGGVADDAGSAPHDPEPDAGASGGDMPSDTDSPRSSDAGGCACTVGSSTAGSPALGWLLAPALLCTWRRRTRRRALQRR